jgi:MerR family mercuric resistance operon transcriptional regulator
LDEIRALLGFVDGGDYTCAEVRDRTAVHLHDVGCKIRDLKRMQRTLRAMIARCDGGSVPDCPIIDALLSD